MQTNSTAHRRDHSSTYKKLLNKHSDGEKVNKIDLIIKDIQGHK